MYYFLNMVYNHFKHRLGVGKQLVGALTDCCLVIFNCNIYCSLNVLELASVQPETEDHRKVNKHLDIAWTLMQTIQLSKDKMPTRLKGKLDLVKQCVSSSQFVRPQKEQLFAAERPNQWS